MWKKTFTPGQVIGMALVAAIAGAILGGDLRSAAIQKHLEKELDKPGIVKDVVTVAGTTIARVELVSNAGYPVIVWIVAKDDLWSGDKCDARWVDDGSHSERFAFKSKRE